VVDKVALGQVYSEYVGFPCQFSFHKFYLSSGTDIIGQFVADVPSGLTLIPPPGTEREKKLPELQKPIPGSRAVNLSPSMIFR
jgi:hypothetical protein